MSFYNIKFHQMYCFSITDSFLFIILLYNTITLILWKLLYQYSILKILFYKQTLSTFKIELQFQMKKLKQKINIKVFMDKSFNTLNNQSVSKWNHPQQINLFWDTTSSIFLYLLEVKSIPSALSDWYNIRVINLKFELKIIVWPI